MSDLFSLHTNKTPAGPTAEERQALSVTELNRQARMTIEQRFNQIWVSGELSSFARPSSGHWYFTLKDAKAQVRCAMFANANRRARLQPANGQQVLLRGRVSLYEGRGEFQIIVEHMEPAGEGALRAAFDALKRQLDAEGLFDPKRKRALPNMPKHVAVVTSPTGAALKDVLSVWQRRYPALNVTVVPTAVQGAEAEGDILMALQRAAALAPDVILLTRGGGSMEDLWVFNAESIARLIAAFAIPVVSAIGHEIDVSITDFVADLRAPTPSAAAELIVPDGEELLQVLAGQRRRLQVTLQARLRERRLSLEKLALGLVNPQRYCQQAAQRLDDLTARLTRAVSGLGAAASAQLRELSKRLTTQRPDRKLLSLRADLHKTRGQLQQALQRDMDRRYQHIGESSRMLNNLSPLPTLARGYAVLRDRQGNVISDASALRPGQQIAAQLRDGRLTAEVTDIAIGATLDTSEQTSNNPNDEELDG
jgi:exodeoxyribonuclease VII large subunit